MLPIEFLFASVNPIVVLRLRCRSHDEGHPLEVPPHITRALELRVVSSVHFLAVQAAVEEPTAL